MLPSSALLTRAESRAAEAGTDSGALMEIAAKAASDILAQLYAPCPVLIICGSGNNGGDGKIIARLLQAQGWPATLTTAEDFNPDQLNGKQLLVDAIFGTGLARPVAGKTADTINAMNASRIPIFSIDIASGIDCDSGAVLGTAIRATHTVTFVRPKPGHLLLPGKLHTGLLHLADIGISGDNIDAQHFVNAPPLWISQLPRLSPSMHKYDRGHALVIGGGVATTGAGRLAAISALRAGAGLVSVACSPEALPIYANSLTSVMTKPFSSTAELHSLLEDRRITAQLIGPGCGVNDATRLQTLHMLACHRPCVIDADALSAFEHTQNDLFAAIAGPVILTPHEGEFARLFSLEGDKVERAREAARRSGAIIVLKGADTVITSPDGRIVINGNAPPSLATAGAGDVLSGIITGLLAQGMPAFEAACAAVWMHGAAAQHYGPGLIADDLPGLLPYVWRDLAGG